MTLYSTLFDDEFASSDSHTELSASLVLAKALKFQISNRLDASVTHILCDIREECIDLSSQCISNVDFATSSGQGKEKLHAVLEETMMKSQPANRIYLVSPAWIRSKWDSL